MVACEDAYESERVGVMRLVAGAEPGDLWVADSHFEPIRNFVCEA